MTTARGGAYDAPCQRIETLKRAVEGAGPYDLRFCIALRFFFRSRKFFGILINWGYAESGFSCIID